MITKLLFTFYVFLLISCIHFPGYGQERTITGKISSAEDGLPLPGATVIVKGTTLGTSSNVDGTYSLIISDMDTDTVTLIYSFIGMESQEVKPEARRVIDIILIEAQSELNELVVTAAGISREASTLGYSVSKINTEYLTQAQVTNPAAGLSGKVSGVQISQVDNAINGPVRIVLRGNRSLLGNNQALLVVDGAQVPSDYINSINPSDIESTTILKGPTAASLYGSWASNGVIIITTKKGTEKEPEITLGATIQWETISYFPKFQTRFGAYGGESMGDDVFDIDPEFGAYYVAYENQSYGPEFNGQTVQVGRPIYIHDKPVYQYTDYAPKLQDHYNFFQSGFTQQYSGSVAAGTDRLKYYFSFQDVTRTGVLPRDKYRRDVFRMNSKASFHNFSLGYSISYTITDQEYCSNRRQVYVDWMNTPMHIPLTRYKNWDDTNTTQGKFSSPSGYFNDFFQNPYFTRDRYRGANDQRDFNGSIELSINPFSWLTVRETLNFFHSIYSSKSIDSGVEYDRSFANPSKTLVVQGDILPSVSDFLSNRQRINHTFLAIFQHDFSLDLNAQFIIGNNIILNRYTSVSVGANSLVQTDPIIYNPAYRTGNLEGGSYLSKNNLIGNFLDLTVSYKFITLHSSVRHDQTSLLSKKNRSFTYPEVDLAFLFSEAIPALQNSIINFGKLTLSIAKVGNVNLGPYALNPTFNAARPYTGSAGNIPVHYKSTRLVSDNLNPEFTLAKEIGVEMSFFNNLSSLKVAYYETKTTNQTVSFGVSAGSGYESALINTGRVDNKGLELDLRFTLLKSQHLTWSIEPNYTYLIDNSVHSIYTGPGGKETKSIGIGNDAFAVVGEQYPLVRVTDWERDPDGRVIVDQYTGFPSKSVGLITVGQGQPKHRVGIQNYVTFKNLSLSVLLDYRKGGVIYNQLGNDIDFAGLGHKTIETGRRRFVFPNSVYTTDHGKTYTPNTHITVNDGNYTFWPNLYNTIGTNYVTSSDFLKLREVSLSYKLDQAPWWRMNFIKSATISLIGRNLLMWRPAENQWTDPEFNNGSGNASGTTTSAQLPPTRTYGFTIQLTF